MDKRLLTVIGMVLALAAAGAPSLAVDLFPAGGPNGLGGAVAADSLRSNLWVMEALMGEIVAEAARSLPPAPARVQLTGRRAANDLQGELLYMVSARVLRDLGYEVLAAEPDSGAGAPAAAKASFAATQVALSYPDVGRTLGLWRRWVDRDVVVVVTAEIIETGSGRLLLSDRLERRFSDRVTNDEFPRVNSTLYPFTSAAIGENGWQRRLEEFAVLGTLAGLVAVYFANTGD